MHQIIIMLLTSWLSSCTVLLYAILIFCVPFPYGVWGRNWDSIVTVPDHCFPIYFGWIKTLFYYMDRVKRIWYLSPMRAVKVQVSLCIHAVSPEPSLLAHTSSESRGAFRQKARSLAPLNGWAYAVKICHDGMLEDTNSLDAAHMIALGFILGCHSRVW